METLERLGPERIALRIEATEPEALRGAASAFDAAAQKFQTVRGRMRGVVVDTLVLWDSDAGRRFSGYSDDLLTDLAGACYSLSSLSRQLRAHADETEDAQARLRSLLNDGSPPGDQADAAKTAALERVTGQFHESEKRVRAALWSLGEQAPGGIPPPVTPPPPQSLWQALLAEPQPQEMWLEKDGQKYGADEDGNVVPAHRGHPLHVKLVEAGGGGAILRFALRLGKGADEAAELGRHVTASHGWRAAHIDRHVREFFNLSANQQVPHWAKAEFLKLVTQAGTNSGKVFRWTLRGTDGPQETFAILHRDPATRQWVAVHFYQSGLERVSSRRRSR